MKRKVHWVGLVIFAVGVIFLNFIFGRISLDRLLWIYPFVLVLSVAGIGIIYSAPLIVWLCQAEKANENISPEIRSLLAALCSKKNIPVPELYFVHTAQAHAWSAGISRKHAKIILTEGLLKYLNAEELTAVFAYHVARMDHGGLARSSLASSLAFLTGLFLFWIRALLILGKPGRSEHEQNPVVYILQSIFMPFSALAVRLLVYPSDMLKADQEAARLCGNPLYLASALDKLRQKAEKTNPAGIKIETAHLMTMNPLGMKGWMRLFNVHPSVYQRIARLQDSALQGGFLNS